jgi:hypothetical protein
MTTKKIKITMSERRPLTIVDCEWPVIAKADWWNGEHRFQANYERRIRVREHADGRRIVYGTYDSGGGGVPVGFRGAAGGFLLDKAGYGRPGVQDERTVRAIRRVAGIIGDDAMADECIADLPAESIDDDETSAEPSEPRDEIRLPCEGAMRMMRTLSEAASSSFCDPRYAKDLQAIADELAAVLTK